ncbi:RNA 2'-phosphotransferase [Candidatus Albibeggiatoa sp. nov. NOAA]|uniref:RNA 2'-phosphotransferase n=1 Tax=Candidatus Albibeggiatoa sp. nov. NOAA TaxID=3162724 RepID=UPI0032F27872|nr:RNA 2'-phosphotransferase [Thiotrichaceae bacterium]
MQYTEKTLKKVSKFLSYVLRHCPEDIKLTLDTEGWASIEELIEKAQPKFQLNHDIIKHVVATNNKQRFKISADGLKIRANQGHSIDINLNLTPQEPPKILYHGTATRFLDSILKQGLKSGNRQHVHLSKDMETAIAVGQRHGKPVILQIDTQAMSKQGHIFFLSDNKVWLTEHVPAQFLSLITNS